MQAQSVDGAGPLARIRVALPGLAGTARACAQYVLDNAWEVRGLSIDEVAARSGVSKNAVNRFSRALSYRGYRDFSQALALELGQILGGAYALPQPLTRPAGGVRDGGAADEDSAAGVIARVFALEIEALHDTLRTLDAQAAERAVDAIVAAESVLFMGTGAAMPLSELAAYRLKVLGMRASWAGDPGTITPEIHLLRPGDVVCAISYHGSTRYVVEALQHARDRGLTTICITAVPGSPIAQAAGIRLVAFGQQAALGFGQFASRVASAALLDALAAAVAWRRRDQSVAHASELVQHMVRHNTVLRGSPRRDGRAAQTDRNERSDGDR
ncbi:MAG: MurR/RpiR family transcriptional regulator [Chloroflexi bacterium]|nr:MurR/RpiR family transcriptional regulator [Chloroflexota bacterium]